MAKLNNAYLRKHSFSLDPCQVYDMLNLLKEQNIGLYVVRKNSEFEFSPILTYSMQILFFSNLPVYNNSVQEPGSLDIKRWSIK